MLERIPYIFKVFCPIAAIVLSQATAWQNLADAADRTAWATGAEFQQRLAQPVDILWASNPLRTALQNLGNAQQVAILIDRRIDPGQKLDLAVQDASLQSALQTIAEHGGLGISRLGDVVYFGPSTAAEQLRPIEAALKQHVRQLPMTIQRKFFQSKPLAWDDLATPRDLLAQLAGQNDLDISNLDLIPHDLWAAADLPPLSLIDRLTLIAVQFAKTFKIDADGKRLELIAVPDNLPAATEPFAGMSPPRSRPQRPTGEPATNIERIRIQRITIQDERLGSVLRQLADRLGLELKIDQKALQEAGISLDRRVTLTVENVSVDELFTRLLDSTGLKAHRRRKVVEIVPGK